jgi:ATP-dependent DNA helicase RecQ
MKKITANYVHAHPVFVIQNLDAQPVDNQYLPVYLSLKNLLQSRFPAPLSHFLSEEIGDLHRLPDFEPVGGMMMLTDAEIAVWHHRIRGDERLQSFPAKKLMEELFPEVLGEWAFVQQMFLPEMQINDITAADNIVFRNQSVDFYLPQANLIVEIDGQPHKSNDRQRLKDNIRDEYLKKFGIETVHLQANDVEQQTNRFKQGIAAIIEQLKLHDAALMPYKKTYQQLLNGFHEDDLQNKLLPTAIMRFQWLVVELLLAGKLTVTQPTWELLILERDVTGFVPLACEDLWAFINKMCEMHQVPCQKPVLKLLSLEDDLSDEVVAVDFSLFKRWTDEADLYPQCIFVRNDYFDLMHRENGKSADKVQVLGSNLVSEFTRYLVGTHDSELHFEKVVQDVTQLKGAEQQLVLEGWLQKAAHANLSLDQKQQIATIILKYYPDETVYLARQLDAPFLLNDTIKSKFKQLQNLNQRLYEKLKAIR